MVLATKNSGAMLPSPYSFRVYLSVTGYQFTSWKKTSALILWCNNKWRWWWWWYSPLSQHFVPNYTGSAKPKYGVLDHPLLRRRTADCIIFMVSAVNISREPRFPDTILARDCVRPPVPSSWFLLHTATHLATMHFHLQEQGHGMWYHPVSPLQDMSSLT